MGDPRTLTAVARQFSLACSLISLYYTLTLGEYAPGWFFPPVLLPYSLLVYGVNRLFLRRERTMRALCLLNGGMAAAALCAYLYFEGWKGTAYLAACLIFIGWLTGRGAQTAYSGPDLRGTLLTLDGSFLCLLLMSAYCSFAQADLQWCIPAIAGFAAAILAMACARNSQPLGVKSWLVMLAAFAALFLCLGVLLTVVAAPAGGGLVALWSMLLSAVQTLSALVLRGIVWLISLLPSDDTPPELLEQEPPPVFIEEVPVEQVSPVVGVIALILLIAALIAAAVWLVRFLGRIKVGGRTVKPAAPGTKRERISFWAGLLTLVRRWLKALRLRRFLRKNRNTPTGLYFLLVHRCRRAPWHKQPGETPREFLLRMARSAGDDPELAQALTVLAGAVDAAFYASAPLPYPAEQAGLVRRRSGAAARRQFLRDMLARVKPNRTVSS